MAEKTQPEANEPAEQLIPVEQPAPMNRAVAVQDRSATAVPSRAGDDSYLTAKQRADVERLGDAVIWVTSGGVDDRAIIFQKAKSHPGGELFVGGRFQLSQPAARSAEVMRLLGENLLIQVPGPGYNLDYPDRDPEDTVQPGAPENHNRLFARGTQPQLGRAGADGVIPLNPAPDSDAVKAREQADADKAEAAKRR